MLNKIDTLEQLKEVVHHNDIAVVDLYATWCKPCQEMLPVIEELSNQTSVPFYKVDIDEVPDGLLAKMFVDLLAGMEGWYSTRCTMTWKGKAMKSSRFLFQLLVSTHHTEGIESGLLLTPTTREEVMDLDKFKARMEKYPNGTTMPNLATQLLHTPRASDKNMHWKTKNWKGDDLGSQINEMYGTRSHLSPQFVMEMMGFPTDWTILPFLNGETNPSKPEEMQ